jgi:lambda family phage portal protein
MVGEYELDMAYYAATAPINVTVPSSKQNSTVPVVSINDLKDTNAYSEGYSNTHWDGDKYYGGFGITKDYDIVDYWKLRKRSKQLFTENLYARGLIRRLLTNEINKGLALEATPDASILKMDEDTLAEWSEMTERLFNVWGKNPELCDHKKLRTFGADQKQARMMALISGDVLVIVRQGEHKLPTLELVDADLVEDPASDARYRRAKNRGNKIKHGVEIDSNDRHVAFYVRQADDTHKRVPARGVKTGRKQAWLVYGTERMIGDVRGQSLLALVVQSLKEVDRYRDAEQRAAVINSMIAMWVKKTEDKMGTLPVTGGAVRKDTFTTQDDSQGRKDVQFSSNMPGMIMQELQTGEEPVSYDTRRPNVNFGTFEAAIINAIAWANEIPPEVLTLAFQNNYSASRGAVNEFKMYLERIRNGFGEEFNDPIYQEFLISATLIGAIDMPRFLESRRDPSQWHTYGAWVSADWSGAIKPNVDLLKEAKAYKLLCDEGWITRERATRELTGMKYSKSVQQLVRENEQLAAATQPLIDAGIVRDQNPDAVDAVIEAINNLKEE